VCRWRFAPAWPRLPVIASDVGGIQEVIAHGKTGLLVPSADAADFEEKFIAASLSLMFHPEQCDRLGGAAHQFIQNDYSLPAAVRDVEYVYREILN
jgi:glycosyltransferase involved in cell wall biosynthesis